MPRPIFRAPQQQQQAKTETTQRRQGILSTRQDSSMNQQQHQMNQMQLARILRKPRSKAYMEAMHCLDNGGHVHNRYKVNAIIEAIRQEFPEVELQGILLGVVSRCYLGAPYEVHSLDMTGQIIEHYKGGQAMPNGMEKARGIALCGSYEFVEVYTDCCRAVSSSGSVAVIA